MPITIREEYPKNCTDIAVEKMPEIMQFLSDSGHKKRSGKLPDPCNKYGADERTRTFTHSVPEPKSGASANSATSAYCNKGDRRRSLWWIPYCPKLSYCNKGDRRRSLWWIPYCPKLSFFHIKQKKESSDSLSYGDPTGTRTPPGLEPGLPP